MRYSCGTLLKTRYSNIDIRAESSLAKELAKVDDFGYRVEVRCDRNLASAPSTNRARGSYSEPQSGKLVGYGTTAFLVVAFI